MNNPGLVKNFIAETAVAPYRIIKFGSTDDAVVQATGVNDGLFGVSNNIGGDIGKRVDVIMSDVAEVEYGGTIVRGSLLTSDANGKAVASAPAAGVNNRIIGTAMVSGALGDIGSVLIDPNQIQG